MAQRSVHDWFVENISQGANQHLIICPWERCVVRCRLKELTVKTRVRIRGV